MNSQGYSIASAAGELAAGDTLKRTEYQIISGYFGGQFGNSQTFRLLSSQVGQAGARPFSRVPPGSPF